MGIFEGLSHPFIHSFNKHCWSMLHVPGPLPEWNGQWEAHGQRGWCLCWEACILKYGWLKWQLTRCVEEGRAPGTVHTKRCCHTQKRKRTRLSCVLGARKAFPEGPEWTPPDTSLNRTGPHGHSLAIPGSLGREWSCLTGWLATWVGTGEEICMATGLSRSYCQTAS